MAVNVNSEDFMEMTDSLTRIHVLREYVKHYAKDNDEYLYLEKAAVCSMLGIQLKDDADDR